MSSADTDSTTSGEKRLVLMALTKLARKPVTSITSTSFSCSLSLFWLVAPVMGLIIQPLVGAASDKTWNKFGRRNPYILIGAICATLGMLMMPNAAMVVSFITPMIFGVMMLALMDSL
mgnify:CR=1 FL=1